MYRSLYHWQLKNHAAIGYLCLFVCEVALILPGDRMQGIEAFGGRLFVESTCVIIFIFGSFLFSAYEFGEEVAAPWAK